MESNRSGMNGTLAKDDANSRSRSMETLTYDGPIAICADARALARALRAIEDKYDDCGFDLEWRVEWRKGRKERKVALMQIACATEDLRMREVVLVRTCATGMTTELRRWLRGKMRKCGANARGDARKVRRDFAVRVGAIVELNELARERYGKPANGGTWSLKALCERALGKTLAKDKTRTSDWERETLTSEQVKYAACDAWAGLLAYRALRRVELRSDVAGEGYVCDVDEGGASASEDASEDASASEEEGEEQGEREGEEVDAEDDVGDFDARGEMTMQSTRVAMIDLTPEEALVYERHVAGATVSAIALEHAMEFQATLDALVMAIRKGSAFYFDLLEIPRDLTAYFYDYCSAHGAPPKLANFAERSKLTPQHAKSCAILLALKLAREREV